MTVISLVLTGVALWGISDIVSEAEIKAQLVSLVYEV